MARSRSSIRNTAGSDRHQLPMFCVEKSIAPATCNGKYFGGAMTERKYRKKNGCRRGTMAAAGLRQTHLHPIQAQAGSTRPRCGWERSWTSVAKSTLPGHPPGPVDSEHEQD